MQINVDPSIAPLWDALVGAETDAEVLAAQKAQTAADVTAKQRELDAAKAADSSAAAQLADKNRNKAEDLERLIAGLRASFQASAAVTPTDPAPVSVGAQPATVPPVAVPKP